MANFNTSKESREHSILITSEATLAPANAPIVKREWLRIADATRLFGIGRSSLYELIGEGKLKSASIRKRNNIRGIRLISATSLESYLESIAEGGPRKKSKASK